MITGSSVALAQYETGVRWKYTDNVAIRGYYRREYEKLDDFDYTGLTNIAANNIYLGAIPENCTAQLFGVFF